MASKKDMRRPDLAIPYQVPAPKEGQGDFAGTIATTLPMAAMFMRNKYVGWASVAFALQTWLGESQDTKSTSSQPAIFGVLMAFMSLAVSYMQVFLPTPGSMANLATGTEAPSAAPAPGK